MTCPSMGAQNFAHAAGARIAKHGNRNLSSRSGAADALTEMGINVMVGAEVVERALAEAGIAELMDLQQVALSK